MLAESFITLTAFLLVQAPSYQDPRDAVAAINSLPVAKYVADAPFGPIKVRTESLGVDVTARAALVLDVASGRSLFEKDEQTAYPIASLSKLMTAMTFLDTHPDLSEEVVVLAEDDPHEGRAVFPTGERFTKQELLQALLIGSVNTAGNVIARTTGGREAFVHRMNEKAHELHLQRATFFEPTGLDARNQATAHDVALMLRAALSYPQIREITEHSSIVLPGRVSGHVYTIDSTNLLLGSFLNKAPYRIIAAKTGSLPEAGFCLAQVTRHEGNEIITVVLGSSNHFVRFQDVKSLTYWAFQTYAWPTNTIQAASLRR